MYGLVPSMSALCMDLCYKRVSLSPIKWQSYRWGEEINKRFLYLSLLKSLSPKITSKDTHSTPSTLLPVCLEPFSVHQIKSWLSSWVCLVSQYLISAPKSLLTGFEESFSARSPCRTSFQQRSLGPILALPKRF